MASQTGPAYLVLARDERGAPYAVEVVEAEEWEPALEEPPERERADVRIVRLGGAAAAAPPPSTLPRWLAVASNTPAEHAPAPAPPPPRRAERPRRVAEAAAAYETRPAPASAAAGDERGDASERALAERL
jgi:hypothetical protein